MPSWRAEGLHNNMANGRCLCNPIYRFLKEFNNLSTLSMSNVPDEWKSWHHLHNHGGLSSSPGKSERPGWAVTQNWSHSNENWYRQRSEKEPESARFCVNTVCDIYPYICCSVFSTSILTSHSEEFETPVINLPCSVYTLFRFISIILKIYMILSLVKYWLWGRKFEIFC